MTHGASAVIISREKILLFHRDHQPGIPFPGQWQLPGGGMEEGETPLEAVKRELFEEVTHVPKVLTPMGSYKNKSGDNNIFISFVSPDEEKLFKHKPGEGQEIGFFTLDEALALDLTPPLRWFMENKRKEIEEMTKSHKIAKAEIMEMEKME